jgi:hypothetical protein
MFVNAKMVPVQTVLSMGGGEMCVKGSSGGGEFKSDIFDTV